MGSKKFCINFLFITIHDTSVIKLVSEVKECEIFFLEIGMVTGVSSFSFYSTCILLEFFRN